MTRNNNKNKAAKKVKGQKGATKSVKTALSGQQGSQKVRDKEVDIRPQTQARTRKHIQVMCQESSESKSEQVRIDKVASKRRWNRADLIESAELREATVRSLKDTAHPQYKSEEERQYDKNLRLAEEVLAREHEVWETAIEFNQ
ncbi:hypothetical protein K438DRAFT_1754951 [Mycena galopus ATCC 62051]|nr:hypothetical protein K438DRAFT_1754951 [Mycena galopus ATCC 62051]